MRVRVLFVFLVFVLAAACTSEAEEAVPELTTTVAESTTTSSTEPPATTSTTLSEAQLIAEAEAEIEAAITGWYEFGIDTSLGEAGLPMEFITGTMEDRMVDLAETRTAAGEIQRGRGGDAIEVLDIRVDLIGGIADADVCASGDAVLLDAETGEELDADDGDAWEGRVELVLEGETWLVEDFFSDEATGGNECELS